MSILRTPQVDQLQQPDNHDEERRSVELHQGSATLKFMLIGAISVGFFVGVLGLSALLARGEPGPAPQLALPPTVAVTQQPTATLAHTPTPSCASGQPQLVLINDLERRGDWTQAASVANAALNLQGLCEGDRPVLTEKAVAAGLKALMEAPHRKTDRAQHQQLVDQYLALQVRARDAGISIMPALQFAEEAYGRSQFLLSKVAIEQALEAGNYQPDVHRDVTRLYISSLYGLCYWYTTDMQGSETYQHGLSYCAASDQLANTFCTGQGEAATKLNELVGVDRQRWPQPAKSPLDSSMREGCT
jgi:hypothetical protein